MPDAGGPVPVPAADNTAAFLGPMVVVPDAGPPAGVYQWPQETSRRTGSSAKRISRSVSRTRSVGRHIGVKIPGSGSAAAVSYEVSVDDDTHSPTEPADAATSPSPSPAQSASWQGGGLGPCGSGAAAGDLSIDTSNVVQGLTTLAGFYSLPVPPGPPSTPAPHDAHMGPPAPPPRAATPTRAVPAPVPTPEPAPDAPAGPRPVLYHTILDLKAALQRGVVINMDSCAQVLFDELVAWMDMLSDKCHARIDRERAEQTEATRIHTVNWDALGPAGHHFRRMQGGKGRSRGSRLSLCHSWVPSGPDDEPPWLPQAEQDRREEHKEDTRVNDRVGAAIRKMVRFSSASGIASDMLACQSDEARKYNRHRSERAMPNYLDERRCPRCCSTGHATELHCPMGAALPNVVARGRASVVSRPVDERGDPLQGLPYCRLCQLWGHPADACVLCTRCMRYGHSMRDCRSGYTL